MGLRWSVFIPGWLAGFVIGMCQLSRVFAGVHFLFDLTAGQRLGSDVAASVVDHFLTSRDRDD